MRIILILLILIALGFAGFNFVKSLNAPVDGEETEMTDDASETETMEVTETNEVIVSDTGTPAVVSGTQYSANLEESSVEWFGKKVGGEHNGVVSMTEGTFGVENDVITNGRVVINMASIESTDPAGGEGLDSHLKSPDFFNTETYPEAVFEVVSVEAKDGGVNAVTGNITIVGQTVPVTLDAILVNTDGVINVTGDIVLDRTQFGITFGSGLIGTAKDKIINDEFTLSFDVVANAS